MVRHACNLSTQEAEAGGMWVLGPSLGYIVWPCLQKIKQRFLFFKLGGKKGRVFSSENFPHVINNAKYNQMHSYTLK
jgi:hypothetical protein